MGVPTLARSAPYIWDEDGDRIDDRIESVNLGGYRLSFERGDSLLRQRIEVSHGGQGLIFSVFVVFDHTPTPDDLLGLTLLGMPVLHRYEEVPGIRSLASYAQIDSVSRISGVERVEAVSILYPMLHEATASIGARDLSGQVFPTWETDGGGDGTGIVIAFLDTGVNDGPDGSYPGHESLAGKCLGGAVFLGSDSTLDTPRNGSVNPADRGGALTQSHGTHVASIALGTGGPTGYARGVAPGARFVDLKVLSDAGLGTGVAEGLDWCIHNRARDWGGPPGFEGIDVINLSLSSVDQTDGNDLVSRLANRAVELGMVVVASMGNDGEAGHVPSPAGADRVLAVGAYDDQRTPLSGDDRFASFDNYGPRASDGDGDPADEEKPDLLAPGVAILAADGDELSDGAQYKRLSGTSMAVAVVSGAVAALRSNYPSLTPDQVAALLRATASRRLSGAPVGEGGADPRWSSPIGFGALDLYAARLELEQPQHSQIVRLEMTGAESQVDAVLFTQREYQPGILTIERAPDLDGTPGTFVPYDAVTATGDSSLADADNRGVYAREWTVPKKERGTPFWYRVAYTEGSTHYETPIRRYVSPTGPSVATIELTLVHNALDHDVSAQITVGAAQGALPIPGSSGSTSPLVFPVPASSAAASSDWVTGASATGNIAWSFRIEVPYGAAEDFLPPSQDSPWRLEVSEGGYLNRSGRITAYRLVWHRNEGDVAFEGGPAPQQTAEGQTAVMTIPSSVLNVDPLPPSLDLRFGPNPVMAGEAVTFSSNDARRGELEVYDLGGREIGRAVFHPAGSMHRARWETRDASGRPLPAGVYFARCGPRATARLVVMR